jgi:hypothetical protein
MVGRVVRHDRPSLLRDSLFRPAHPRFAPHVCQPIGGEQQDAISSPDQSGSFLPTGDRTLRQAPKRRSCRGLGRCLAIESARGTAPPSSRRSGKKALETPLHRSDGTSPLPIRPLTPLTYGTRGSHLCPANPQENCRDFCSREFCNK